MLIHVVERGETLFSIARRYGVSVERLRSDNALAGDTVVVGQALLVSFPAEVYTVQRGDTLYALARRYGISIWELLRNNPTLSLTSPLRPGEMLTVAFRGGKQRMIRVGGYAYPNIARTLLTATLPFLTYLWIFSYGFTEQGSPVPIDDTALVRLARSYDTVPLLVLTTIGTDGQFSAERAELLLRNENLQQTLLQNLLGIMREKGYGGLDVDFEYIPAALKENYIAFLWRCGDLCRENGLLFTTVAAPKTFAAQPGLLYEAHDYPRLGAVADRLFLMTYEWGYTYGPPMAVAPISQVRRVAEYAVTEVTPQKLLLGIPNYGYDWHLPYQPNTAARSIGNEQAVRIAAAHGAEIGFDENAASPYFYYAENGQPHVVWFEDVRSIERKLNLVDALSLGGIGYWNLMRPFRQNWAFLAARYAVEKGQI